MRRVGTGGLQKKASPRPSTGWASFMPTARVLPLDYEYAYAWKSVAASQGHREARASLQTTKGQLSPTEFEEAEKLSEQFIQRYGPKPGSATNDHP